jgi:hypothetical protein
LWQRQNKSCAAGLDQKLILSLHVETQVPKSNFGEPFQLDDVMEKAKGVAA